MSRNRKRDDFGLPSGDDPAAYDGAARTKEAWRWEFLRRRRDYQDDWMQFHRAWQARQVREYSALPLPAGVTSWRAHFAGIAQLPNNRQREKFGVLHVVDPACAWEPSRFFGVFLSGAEELADAARNTDTLIHGDVITTCIDLR